MNQTFDSYNERNKQTNKKVSRITENETLLTSSVGCNYLLFREMKLL